MEETAIKTTTVKGGGAIMQIDGETREIPINNYSKKNALCIRRKVLD